MRIKEKNFNDLSKEFEVFCYNCRNVLVVEGPEDMEKEYIRIGVLLYIKCPKCSCNIIIKKRYDEFQKFNITVDLLNKIRTRKVNLT